jgi:hypothetical protein
MAFSLIASGQASASGNNDGFTSGALDTTGANLLIAHVVSAEATTAPTLSDSKGNTWNGLTVRVANGRSRLFYATSTTVGTGHTFTLTGTDIWGLIQVQAWSGAHPTAPFDLENGSNSGGSPDVSLQPGSITPSENNCLVVSGIANSLVSGGSYSIDSGFAISHQKDFENPINTPGGLAYLVQTTAPQQ